MDGEQEALFEDGTSVGKPDVVAGLFELIRTLCKVSYIVGTVWARLLGFRSGFSGQNPSLPRSGFSGFRSFRSSWSFSVLGFKMSHFEAKSINILLRSVQIGLYHPMYPHSLHSMSIKSSIIKQ